MALTLTCHCTLDAPLIIIIIIIIIITRTYVCYFVLWTSKFPFSHVSPETPQPTKLKRLCTVTAGLTLTCLSGVGALLAIIIIIISIIDH